MRARMMMFRSQRWALAGLCVLSGALAACSSGGATPAPRPAATQPAAAASASANGTAAATAAAKSAATQTAAAATGPGGVVGVNFAEFSIAGSSTVGPGRVTFEVSNSGMLPHNLHVVKSDAALTALPQKDGQVDVSKVQVVAKTADIAEGGADLKVDATLAPGRYIMLCNVLGHYQAGMVKELTVR